jgi:hypothetical protein
MIEGLPCASMYINNVIETANLRNEGLMNHDLELLAKHFKYKSDKDLDSYRILPLEDPQGDCDDYAPQHYT